MRVSTSTTVFHRIPVSGVTDDMAEHDVGTSDANASGIGGTGEFQIAADSAGVDYTVVGEVFDDNESAPVATGTINQFISIKNTGFTTADKDTAVADGASLTVGLAGAFATGGGFTLMAGEQITLHGLGAANNTLAEMRFDSSVAGGTYVEIVYL
tara:strand:+ start:74 stop:538 length:465 start_codon:yes stop_codon:yes gene_type:complete